MSLTSGDMGIRTPDLLHAIGTLLGSFADSVPSGVSGGLRSGAGRGLQWPENRGQLRDTGPREFSLRECRRHGHPACCFRLGP